jgi:hypothetical protein
MAFTLSKIPGFSDLPDRVLEAEQPALGMLISRINGNASFGMVRPEVFVGRYKDGETVNLPVSTVDGYTYQRSELMYIWGIYSTVNPATGWISGPGALWYAAWKVDQSSGAVSCIEFYRKSEGKLQDNSAASQDGVLQVFTIAQRQAKTLTIEDAPSYIDLDNTVFEVDDPLATTPLTQLSRNAKFAVANAEVIYMGEFWTGQTVPNPVSPADGHIYSYGETKFQFSWRWTTVGSEFTQPDFSFGQLHRIEAAVNPANGLVSTAVAMYNSGVIATTWGRIAVFAFCQRSDAAVVQVTVPGTAMPWEFTGGINASFAYGVKNGTAPVLIPLPMVEGQSVDITYLGGLVRMSDSRPYVDAAGQSSYDTTTAGGSTGTGFPGAYVGGSGRLGDLIYAFVVRATGVVISVGRAGLSATLTVPAGADALQLGIDDDNYADNVGSESIAVRVGTDQSFAMGDAGPLDFTTPTVVFSTGKLELSTLWQQPGTVGNSGGGDPHATPRGTFTPGTPGVFHLSPIDPFDNAYWYIRFSSMPNAMYFVHKMKVRLPTPTDRAASQAIEWEIQKSLNGKIYNMAWQAEFSGSKWRSFHKIWSGTAWVGHWEDSGITFDPTIWDSGAWVTLESTFLLTPTTITHIDLKINGVTHTVNIVRTPVDKLESNYMTTAFQLDGNSTPTPYNAQVEDYSVEMLTAIGGVPVLPTDPGDASLVFEEIDDSLLFPGNPLPASLMRQLNSNVKMSVARQEFFGPAVYAHGSTVPLPVSKIDGYAYSRAEISYIWEVASTGPEVGGGGLVPDIRFWEFDEHIDENGFVTIHQSRDPTGGGALDTHDGSLRVLIVGIRNSTQGAAYEPDPDLDPRPPTDIPTTPTSGVVGEVPPGVVNGSNVIFTLTYPPLPPQSVQLFRNELLLRAGVDYSISAQTITFFIAPDAGDWLYAYYRVDGNSASYNDALTPSGLINGSNTAFTLPSAPSPGLFLLLYLNAELQIQGSDYTLSGANITMAIAPQPTSGGTPADWLIAWSRIDGDATGSASAEVPTGAINGSNAAFTLAATPVTSTLMLFLNRVLLLPGTHYTLTGAAVAMAIAPGTGDSLVAFYRK